MKQISTALLKAQSKMSNPVKGATNPFFKSKYADLNAVREAVLPVLNGCGISVLQPIVHFEGKNFVKTVLLHESGESIESLTEILYNKPNDAQAQGSGISYARRYALQSFVCVGADDDDGQEAVKVKTQDTELSEAIKDMANCKDIEQLKRIWSEHPKLQKVSSFIEAKDKRKSELENVSQ